ncbi:MAG TPA: amidohydrolase family protein [Nitrososphaeraceae archaeon]|nr:amidohydrolase family protein [Nitrososphaeraceae archaeon]
MILIIRNISMLYGKDLLFIHNGFICINENGIIIDVGREDAYLDQYNFTDTKVYDGTGFLVIPGFINSHTHIADSIGKDISISSTFDEMINPVYGIKKKILYKSMKEHLKYFMRTSAISMMIKGTIYFVDFREGGPEGVELLKESIQDLPIKSVILGRIEYYFNLKKILKNKKQTEKKDIDEKLDKLPKLSLESLSRVLELSDGLGLSGANENTDYALKQYKYKVKEFNKNNYLVHKKKIIAIHAAESKSTIKFSKLLTGKTEVERIINFLKPDILIHMTHANLQDLTLALHNNIGIVLCPRSNGILGNGIPNVVSMLKLGFKISIGTDNIMLNSPDLLQELDYLWKVIKSQSSKYSNSIDPKELLKMITVNPGEIFNLNSGSIEIGKCADLLFIDKYHIDLQPIHNIYSSIIHRLSYGAIKAIMIDGRFINEISC